MNPLAERTCFSQVCGPGKFEAAAPTALADRACGRCAAGSHQPFAAHHAPACPPCAPGEFDDDRDPLTKCASRRGRRCHYV